LIRIRDKKIQVRTKILRNTQHTVTKVHRKVMDKDGAGSQKEALRPMTSSSDRTRTSGLMRGAKRYLSSLRRIGGAVLARARFGATLKRGRPRHDASLPTAYFDAIYAVSPDPWHFAESEYEATKYAATLSALPRPFYPSAFEVGCSIGVLTAQLAPRCGRLLAIDAAAAPLAAARERTAAFTQVEVRQARVPEDWPEGHFELILISELLYFFNVEDLRRLAAKVATALAPGGDIILVHWTGPSEFPLTGDAAVEGFRNALGTTVVPLRQERAEQYRLDVWRRADDGVTKPA
jgi:SAM-dependent methyltransferase